jgi:hypothetical protein
MGQQPSFSMSRVSTANRILLVASLMLVIDSFLPWQRNCVDRGKLLICQGSSSAWGGSAAFLGILMGIATIILLLVVVAAIAGITGAVGQQGRVITSWLTGAIIITGVLTFVIVLFNQARFFAWAGLILILVLAYGGYMRWQEPSVQAPPPRRDDVGG